MRSLKSIQGLLATSEYFRGCCRAAAAVHGTPLPEALALLEQGDTEDAAEVLRGDGLAEFILRELWDTWDEDADPAFAGPVSAMWAAAGEMERVAAAVADYCDSQTQQ